MNEMYVQAQLQTQGSKEFDFGRVVYSIHIHFAWYALQQKIQ